MHRLALALALALPSLALADKPAQVPAPAPLAAVATLETPRAQAADKIGAVTTVHVLLSRPKQAPCTDQLLATAKALQAGGVTAAVVEGIVLDGDLAHPKPAKRKEGASPSEAMTRLTGLSVYGFETDAVQTRAVDQLEEVTAGVDALTALKNNPENLAEDAQVARLHEIQEDLYPANTEWVAASTPLRSFQALETAFAVADHVKNREVMVLIQGIHWPDFEHALAHSGRVGNDTHVALRLVKYECAAR